MRTTLHPTFPPRHTQLVKEAGSAKESGAPASAAPRKNRYRGHVDLAVIDRFDRDIIELLLSWAPYGDPPEDECFPSDDAQRKCSVLLGETAHR